MTLSIEVATTPAQIDLVRSLFVEYETALGVSLCFQGFERELAGLPGDYAAPHGTLLLAYQGDAAVGCVAVRALSLDPGAPIAELKRLYVRPSARGAKLGERLVRQALAYARAAGYHTVRLDTLPTMQAAIRLYEALGFRDIAPYYDNPIPGARYLELVLDHGDPT